MQFPIWTIAWARHLDVAFAGMHWAYRIETWHLRLHFESVCYFNLSEGSKTSHCSKPGVTWTSGSIKPHRTDFCPDGDYYPWPRHRSDHLKGTRWIPSNSYEVFRGQSHGTRLETMISQTSPWPGLNYTGLPQLWFMFNIRSKVMPIPWRRTCGGRSPLLVPLPSVVTLNAFLSVFCNYPSL